MSNDVEPILEIPLTIITLNNCMLREKSKIQKSVWIYRYYTKILSKKSA